MKEPLTMSFAAALAIILLTSEVCAQKQSWTWMDSSGQRHSRADLMKIINQHSKWIASGQKDGKRADLSGASLPRADLRGVNLSGASLKGADFSESNLEGAVFREALWRPSPPFGLTAWAVGTGEEPASSYLDLLAYFFKGLFRSKQEESPCSIKFEQVADATNMSGVRLRGALMKKARFFGTDLSEADLSGAVLEGAVLQDVDLNKAQLAGASLNHALLVDSRLDGAVLTGADLSTANLTGSDLNYADLLDTKLDSAEFRNAVLCDANFEPSTIPTDIRRLATVKGLEFLSFRDRPDALTQLRSQFREKGFREQERKVTYALKWHEAEEYWANCTMGASLACAEFGADQLLLNWTCGYGLFPGRALILLFRLWALCGLVYWLFLRFSSRGGLYLIPSRLESKGAIRHPNLQRIRPHHRSKTTVGWCSSNLKTRLVSYVRRYPLRKLYRRSKRLVPVLRAAFWFSTMSAFNIGFRDISAGRWLRLLTKREYDIKARGWVRVVAGFQALVSVGLLALWLLTYFGRPFE
jgi:uncharacterized protein YjbI with pentapeptide repeats